MRTFCLLLLIALALGARSGLAVAQAQPALPLGSPAPSASPAVPLPGASGGATPTASPGALPSASAGPPALAAQLPHAIFAPGQQQDVAILGAVAPLAATLSAPIADLAIDQTRRVITLTARTPGSATLHVVDARGASVDVFFTVAPFAGTIPESVALTVTGSPANPGFLAAHIRAALARALRPSLLPGAQVVYGTISPPLQPLGAGFVTTVTIPVQIGGEGLTSVAGTTSVSVSDLAVPAFSPPFLFFDDDPERIVADGVLFRGTVDPTRPARLYYYHQDDATPGRRLVVTVSAAQTARVQLVDSSAGPNVDVMSVGHAVTRNFLLAEPANEGIVADVDPAAPFVLRDDAMGSGAGVAGCLDVRILMGGPVTLTVLALAPGEDPAAYAGAPKLPDDGHHRHGTFDLAGVGIRTIAYTVGGPDATYEYGTQADAPPNIDPADSGQDHGDYGVLQQLTFDLANPSASPATVYLYEKPLGGPVRSSFVVDGALKDLGCARVPQHYAIATYTLAPGSDLASSVLTMTDGGSNYPLEVGITEAPPIPQTPPLSAPDGCFPKPVPSATVPAPLESAPAPEESAPEVAPSAAPGGTTDGG